MGELKNYAIKNSNFFKLNAGEEVTVLYKGFKIVPNFFDPDKDSIMYSLEQEGTQKKWTNGSASVAIQFDAIPEGSLISVKKETDGSGRNKYIIKKIS